MKGKADRIVSMVVPAVFLAVVFCYAWYYLDPSVLYFRQQPLFLTEPFFLLKYLGYPGGMAEYLSLFISQFFLSKLAGSILITGIIGLIMFLSYKVLAYFYPKAVAFVLQFLMGLFLIHLHSQYALDFQADVVVIFAFIFSIAYQRIISLSISIRLTLLFFSNVLLFYFFGSMAIFMFTAIVTISEIYSKSRRLFWLPFVFQLLVCCIIVFFTFFIPPDVLGADGWTGKVFPDLNNNTLVYLCLFYGLISFLLLVKLILDPLLEKSGVLRHFFANMRPGIKSGVIFIVSLIIPGIAFLDCMMSYDRPAKDAIQIHVFAGKGEWSNVITTAQRLSLTERKVIFQVNRALYHLGKLPDEAFAYSQYWGEKGLILTSNYSRDVLMLCSDLYFDMGHVKASLHWAYEAQTKQEQSPEVLKRIAINNLIIGEYAAAEKFFHILSKSPVHRKWALHYLACIQDTTRIEKEELIREKRKLLPRKDFYSNPQKPQYDLFMILLENPDNKMAFEYFVVTSMLTHDLSEVVRSVKYLDRLHYTKIPEHMEEALVLFRTLNDNYPVELGKYRVSTQVQKKFARYTAILAKYHKDMKAAQNELYNEFGNTLWYYIHYVSPITTKREMQEKIQ